MQYSALLGWSALILLELIKPRTNCFLLEQCFILPAVSSENPVFLCKWQKCFAPITSWYQRNFCTQVCQIFLPTVYTSAGSPEQTLVSSLGQHSYGTVVYISFSLKGKVDGFLYLCYCKHIPWKDPKSNESPLLASIVCVTLKIYQWVTVTPSRSLEVVTYHNLLTLDDKVNALDKSCLINGYDPYKEYE